MVGVVAVVMAVVEVVVEVVVVAVIVVVVGRKIRTIMGTSRSKLA